MRLEVAVEKGQHAYGSVQNSVIATEYYDWCKLKNDYNSENAISVLSICTK